MVRTIAPIKCTQPTLSGQKVGVMSRDESAMRASLLALTLMTAFLAGLLLNGCDLLNPSPQPTRVTDRIKPEPNFAFTFELYECYTYRLDTFDNRLTLDNIGPLPVVTTSLTLSRDELDAIYRKMVEIQFFSYPDEFSIELPPDTIVSGVDPHPTYRFKVRNGTQVKQLHWEDNGFQPTNEQADKLRELIRLVTQTMEAHPAFKKLPSPCCCM